jgi:hypothetical protein
MNARAGTNDKRMNLAHLVGKTFVLIFEDQAFWRVAAICLPPDHSLR